MLERLTHELPSRTRITKAVCPEIMPLVLGRCRVRRQRMGCFSCVMEAPWKQNTSTWEELRLSQNATEYDS